MGPGIIFSLLTSAAGLLGAQSAIELFYAQDDTPSGLIGALQQYGPGGVLAAIMAFAAFTMYKRAEASHASEVKRLEEELERQRARADRLEQALTARTADIQDKYVTSLEQAKGVIADAVDLMRRSER